MNGIVISTEDLNLISQLLSGKMPHELTFEQVGKIVTRFGINWFNKLGYSDLFRRPHFEKAMRQHVKITVNVLEREIKLLDDKILYLKLERDKKIDELRKNKIDLE